LAAIHPTKCLYGVTKRLNYPCEVTRDTSPSRVILEVFSSATSDRCASTTSLCWSYATLAIMSRVLRFEASQRLRPGRSDLPPWAVRPGPGGLTTPLGRLNRPGWPHLHVESSALALVFWLNRVTQWFCRELLQTPRTRCSLPPISTHDSSPTSSWLDLGFEAQPRNHLIIG
jgi:hypothetical protein